MPKASDEKEFDIKEKKHNETYQLYFKNVEAKDMTLKKFIKKIQHELKDIHKKSQESDPDYKCHKYKYKIKEVTINY